MRLSHGEAQALVSARLDGPLDPVAERELNAHLATCDSCRAFNGSATQLARGLQSLPYLPASPAVTRAVLDRVSAPQTGWSRFLGSMPDNALPVATAIAAAMIIVFASAFAIFRTLDNDEPESLPAITQQDPNVAQQSGGTQQPATEPGIPVSLTGETEPASTNQSVSTEEPEGSDATDQSGELEGQETDATEQPPPTDEAQPVETELPGDGASTSSAEEQPGEPEATDPPPATEEGDGSEASSTESSTTFVLEGDAETPGDAPRTEEAEVATERVATEEPVEPTSGPDETQSANRSLAGPTEAQEEEPIGPSGQSIVTTATPADTEEPSPTVTAEPSATATTEPTATPEPSPTPTVEPTATVPLEPTATATLEPTPTATTEPSPTATTEPTPTPTVEPSPTVEPTATATLEPTATTEPSPTATTEPSPTPTLEPSPSVVPIVQKDETPKTTSEPDEDTPETTGETDAESTEDAGQGEDESPLIEPSGNTDASDPSDGSDGSGGDGDTPETTEESTDQEGDSPLIQPQDGTPDPSGGDESPTEDEDPTGSDNQPAGDGIPDGIGSASTSLGNAPVYSGLGEVEGNPEQRLGLNATGELIFSVNPGRVSLESNGIVATGQDSAGGQAVFACASDDTCVNISSGSRGEGSYTDTPIGWIGGDVIYERLNGDTHPVEFRAVSIDPGTLEPTEDRLLGGGDWDWETLIRPYPVDGGLLVPSPAAWLYISSSSVAAIDANPAGQDLSQIRITPATGIISYVANGTLVLASVQSPGSPIATLPFSGGDYDFSPDGDRVAMLDDDGLQVLDLSGTVIETFPNPEGINVGSLTWLNQGIVYVDFTTNVIRVIQP